MVRSKKSCEEINLALPTTKQLVDIYNTKNIPSSVYWTSEKYRKHQNAYWSVNFAPFKGEKNISLSDITQSKKASIAYTPKSINALVLCIDK